MKKQIRMRHEKQRQKSTINNLDAAFQVTVGADLEHPFFVFGRGWSSASPSLTLARYRLPCHQLKVGDECVSLTHRDECTLSKGATVADSAEKVPSAGKEKRVKTPSPPTFVATDSASGKKTEQDESLEHTRDSKRRKEAGDDGAA